MSGRSMKYRRWTRESMIAAIKKWKRQKKEWPRQSDWDAAAMRASAQRHLELAAEWSARLAEYEHDDQWPPARHLADVFGTFNEAIRAAGGKPRSQGQRTKRETEPSLRAATLGHVVREFYMAEYGADERTVRRALRRIAEVATKLASGMSEDALVEYAYEVMGHE